MGTKHWKNGSIKISEETNVSCTPNHKFILRNGIIKEAKNLKLNDDLIPTKKNQNRKVTEVYLPMKRKKDIQLLVMLILTTFAIIISVALLIV